MNLAFIFHQPKSIEVKVLGKRQTAVLFTIAKTGKQPKSPSMEEWLKEIDAVHLCNGILASHQKGRNVLSAATWMDSEMITPSEASQKDTDTT